MTFWKLVDFGSKETLTFTWIRLTILTLFAFNNYSNRLDMFSTSPNKRTLRDLVITRGETDIVGVRTGDMISDHALIRFNLGVKKPRVEEEWTTSRAWRRLSRDSFASDLAESELCSNLDALTNTRPSTILSSSTVLC